jgi:hypothetical protein
MLGCISILSLLVWGLLSAPAHAQSADSCDFYKKYIPGLYETVCSGKSAGSSGRAAKPQSSSPTFSDALKANPSTLPTQPSPFGIESVFHFDRARFSHQAYGASLIKGYRRIGAGFSTASAPTFFSNDVVHRANSRPENTHFKPEEPRRSDISTLTFGTAVALPLPKGSIPVSLGLSGIFNGVTGTFGFGTGLVARPGIFSVGAGLVRERVSNRYEAIMLYSGLIGVRLPLIELQYDILKNTTGPALKPIHIGTVSLSLGRLILSGSMRRIHYYSVGSVLQTHWSAQFQFNRRFSLGFLYNYIPGANSAAAQFFF